MTDPTAPGSNDPEAGSPAGTQPELGAPPAAPPAFPEPAPLNFGPPPPPPPSSFPVHSPYASPYAAQPPVEQYPAGQPPYPQPPYAIPGTPGDPAGTGWPTSGAAPGYAYPGYPGYPGYPPHPGYYPPRSTNGMAIASMVVSLVGLALLCIYGLGFFAGPVGAILGHISRKKIRETGEDGDGMALTGIIVGWIVTGLGLLAIAGLIALFVAAANDPSAFDVE